MGKDGMTPKEFAEGAGMSLNGVYVAIARKEIPATKIGAKIIIPRPWYEKNIKGEA
jgi:hypothetical protein